MCTWGELRAARRADVIPDLRDTILNTWRTSNRVTVFLVEHLPPELWATAVPGAPRRTIRMIAGHMHNARCTWIKTLGQELGIPVPRSVDRRRVGRRELVPALQRSSHGILRLLTLGCDEGGRIPMASTYVWRNLPLDVGHVLAYFVAHEAHHLRPDRANRAGLGPPTPVGGHGRAVAVDQACGGGKAMSETAAGGVPVIRDVYPYLCVRDAAAAIEFYTRLFGPRNSYG
jgi:uncharacterized damage-inducible protein DinB